MGELHFSISDYSAGAVDGLLFWAISGTVLIGGSILWDVFRFVRQGRAWFRSLSAWGKLGALLPELAPLLTVLVFFFSTTWPTLQYSCYLPSESAGDAVAAAGRIEQIADVAGSPRYHIGDDPTVYLADLVTIDGERYYFLTADGLRVGRKVEINYLPRSRMVLDCVSDEPLTTEAPAPTEVEPTPRQSRFHWTYPAAAGAMIVIIIAMIVYGVITTKRRRRK